MELLDHKTGARITTSELLPEEPTTAGLVIVYGRQGSCYQAVAEGIATDTPRSLLRWTPDRENILEPNCVWFMSEINWYPRSGQMSDSDTACQLTAIRDLLQAGRQVCAYIHANNPVRRMGQISRNIGMNPIVFEEFERLLQAVGRREINVPAVGYVTIVDYPPSLAKSVAVQPT